MKLSQALAFFGLVTLCAIAFVVEAWGQESMVPAANCIDHVILRLDGLDYRVPLGGTYCKAQSV